MALHANKDCEHSEHKAKESEFIKEAVAHVEKGYGKFSAVGVRNDDGGVPRAVKFESDGGETDVITVSTNPETGEVAHETLREKVGERIPEPEQESDEET